MIEALTKLTYDDCKKSCPNVQDFANLKDQAILVTGGTGFIGKWIAEMVSYLNEVGSINIKLYLLGRNIKTFELEVPHLSSKENIVLIEQDVRNLYTLPTDVNYIINASGTPDNREHISQPLRTVETFYKGTNAVLDASTHLNDLKKIIHISSHLIYGQSESEELIKESFIGKMESNSVNHTYGAAKRIAETLCSIYRSTFRSPIIVIRPFAFIGPYQSLDKPWAINNFIRDGILGGPIRILGNGQTVRSYLYASDMANWLLKTLVNGQVGETYNLGSREGISLNDLAKKIKDALRGDIEIVSKSSKESYTNVSVIVPDNSKLLKVLQTEEKYTIDDSINRTIVWNQLNKK
jgi:nucleoside-diphosphate-sugar epimerase